MFLSNYNNINTLESIDYNTTSKGSTWLQHKYVANKLELASEYATICQQYQQQGKWVMFVNSDEAAMAQLASFVDISQMNILCVHLKDHCPDARNSVLQNIKRTLANGNCASMVLSGQLLSANESAELELYAAMGETHCSIIENKNVSH